MASGEHTHWESYFVRVINHGNAEKEFLQLICLDDGIIFHEAEIKKEAVLDKD